MSAMTVAELTEALKALPQDAWIMLEGCDCNNVLVGADFDDYSWRPGEQPKPYVLLRCDLNLDLDLLLNQRRDLA